jgi:hypothetical protein
MKITRSAFVSKPKRRAARMLTDADLESDLGVVRMRDEPAPTSALSEI